MTGLIFSSTFKVTATLAANIGFVTESSANEPKGQGRDVCEVLRFKTADEKRIECKECYCFGHRMSAMC